jgi:GST-like protein
MDLAQGWGILERPGQHFHRPLSRTCNVIDLYFYPSPNGLKATIMLEECGLPYRVRFVNILRGEQFSADFLAISPNAKIPAIVDHDAGPQPLTIFESGAILLYLAEKTGRFLPNDLHARFDALQWLFWQVGGLGPMAGQAHHFRAFAKETVPYGIQRFTDEVNRLYAVLDRRLADREYLASEYSIADIAAWPWIVFHRRQGQSLEDFPSVKRWFEAIRERPAVRRAYEIGHEQAADEEAYQYLYGQSARSFQRAASEDS